MDRTLDHEGKKTSSGSDVSGGALPGYTKWSTGRRPKLAVLTVTKMAFLALLSALQMGLSAVQDRSAVVSGQNEFVDCC